MKKIVLFFSILFVSRIVFAEIASVIPSSPYPYFLTPNAAEFLTQMGYLGAGSIMCSDINKKPETIDGVKQQISQLMNIVQSVANTPINIDRDIDAYLIFIKKYCMSHPNSPTAMAFMEAMINSVGNFVQHGNWELNNRNSTFNSNNNVQYQQSPSGQHNSYMQNNYQSSPTHNNHNYSTDRIDYSNQPQGYYGRDSDNVTPSNGQNGVGVLRY